MPGKRKRKKVVSETKSQVKTGYEAFLKKHPEMQNTGGWKRFAFGKTGKKDNNT